MQMLRCAEPSASYTLQVLDARAIGAHLGPCKGYGFVTMGSIETAAAAIRQASDAVSRRVWFLHPCFKGSQWLCKDFTSAALHRVTW